jgi:hypothetical protein
MTTSFIQLIENAFSRAMTAVTDEVGHIAADLTTNKGVRMDQISVEISHQNDRSLYIVYVDGVAVGHAGIEFSFGWNDVERGVQIKVVSTREGFKQS